VIKDGGLTIMCHLVNTIFADHCHTKCSVSLSAGFGGEIRTQGQRSHQGRCHLVAPEAFDACIEGVT
jgi:hypothetical protein